MGISPVSAIRHPTHMAENEIHTPVMLERTLELLAPALEREGAVVVDATLGMAGHSAAMLSRHPGLTLVGIDRAMPAIPSR